MVVTQNLIPALRRQRQVDFCEFEASLGYRVSSRIGSKTTQRNPASNIKMGEKISLGSPI